MSFHLLPQEAWVCRGWAQSWKGADSVLLFPRWEEKIPLAKTTLEKTWLFHEIGRCYLELDQAWQAQSYGEKSQQYAEEEGDLEWQLNASVLVAQAQGRGSETPILPMSPSARPVDDNPEGRVQHLCASILTMILTTRTSIFFFFFWFLCLILYLVALF